MAAHTVQAQMMMEKHVQIKNVECPKVLNQLLEAKKDPVLHNVIDDECIYLSIYD